MSPAPGLFPKKHIYFYTLYSIVGRKSLIFVHNLHFFLIIIIECRPFVPIYVFFFFKKNTILSCLPLQKKVICKEPKIFLFFFFG